jgi:hypothetical protein
MVYSIGCVVGNDDVMWSRVVRRHGDVSEATGGSTPCVVGVGTDGQLHVVRNDQDSARLTDEASGFVAALGGSEPIMVGSTPYGAEALVAVVLSEIVDTNTAAMGAPPDVMAIIHDDDLDPFRSSLLTEAARLAGLSAEQLVLVTRSAAEEGSPDGDAASGGASIALAGHTPVVGDGVGTALAAGATGLAAGGAVGLGVHVADGEVASAAGTAAGPAGTPLTTAGPSGTTMGPAGTPLGSAGPAGTPLGSAGPAGTPLGSAGPPGTPLGSAGPAGTPLGSAGPAGTPLDTEAPPTSRATVPKPRPRWVPAAVVGGAAAVIAVVGVVVIAQGDDPPEAAVVTTVAIVDDEPGRAATTTPSADTTAPVAETTVEAATGGWVISEDIEGVLLTGVSCDSELGPWTITFDQEIPEGTMTGTLVLTFDDQGSGTGDYSMQFVAPGVGSVDMGGDQWPARIEPSGDGYIITMETGTSSGVATVDGGSFSFGGVGNSETATFAVRPATGECG